MSGDGVFGTLPHTNRSCGTPLLEIKDDAVAESDATRDASAASCHALARHVLRDARAALWAGARGGTERLTLIVMPPHPRDTDIRRW